MRTFLSCDWGTTNFRLRLIDAETCTIISEVTSNEGIQSTYNNWNLSKKPSGERLAFYQSIVASTIEELQAAYGQSLQNIPIIISGMASSSIGMKELTYKEIPVSLETLDLEYEVIKASEQFHHTTLLVSGIKSDDDVIRGEETKIAGCFETGKIGKQLFIIPGTHPKHVVTEGSVITSFSTFMTGEIFHLLSTQSILKASVEVATFSKEHAEAFAAGVLSGSSANILHTLFTTRTNQLFNKYNKADNYFYLSGLLIGHELKEVINTDFESIHLVTNKLMEPFYKAALSLLLPNKTVQTVDSDLALIKGQLRIARALKFV